MIVKDLLGCESFSPITLPDPERSVDGIYIGDLLSWVMGRASADNAWITIMSNVNVIAVATLTDVSCVILAEGVTLSDDIISTAEAKGVNVLSTTLPAYEASVALGKLL